MNTSEQTSNRRAAEEIAVRAYEAGCTVAEFCAGKYEIRYLTRGHTDDESIEHAADLTPELQAVAEAIHQEMLRP